MKILPQIIGNGLIAGSIYALVALGFVVIYRTFRIFHIAHGAVLTLGAYTCYYFSEKCHLSFFPAILLGALAAAISGVMINSLVYRRLRIQKAPNLVFLLASFGIYIFFQNAVQVLFGAQVLSFAVAEVKEGNRLLGIFVTDSQEIILASSLASCLALWIFIRFSKMGKAMQAVADDKMASSLVGINTEQTITASFAVGSMFAGIAGALIAVETNLVPTMGLGAILKGITAAIIGGLGNIPGALCGGLLLGIVENLGVWKIQAGWKDTIAFAILILFLIIRPQGLFGKSNLRE